MTGRSEGQNYGQGTTCSADSRRATKQGRETHTDDGAWSVTQGTRWGEQACQASRGWVPEKIGCAAHNHPYGPSGKGRTNTRKTSPQAATGSAKRDPRDHPVQKGGEKEKSNLTAKTRSRRRGVAKAIAPKGHGGKYKEGSDGRPNYGKEKD